MAQVNDEKRQENQLESIAFTFHLDEKASVAGISTAGIDIASTSIAKAYFQHRLTLTKHPETLTRYGHLLWQLHRYFPGYQAAVSAYLQLAEYAFVTDQQYIIARAFDQIAELESGKIKPSNIK